MAGVLVSVAENLDNSRRFTQQYIPCWPAQSRAACWSAITWLSQLAVWAIRNSKAPASWNSCIASLPAGVRLDVGGPGEKPMGKTLRPFRTRTLSELTVTTEPVWAAAAKVKQRRLRSHRLARCGVGANVAMASAG